MTEVAVITVVSGRTAQLINQHRSLRRSTLPPHHYVVVAIDDPGVADWEAEAPPRPVLVPVARHPDGLPLAAARNRGARAAIDLGAELLVFLDVDCLSSPGMLRAYADAATGDAAVLCGPVAYLPPPPAGGYDLERLDALADPHPARPAPSPGEVLVDPDGHRLFWSLSFSMRRDVWSAVGGFDEAYVGYGAEDTDFGQRCAAAGLPIAWVGGARAHHQHHPVSDPPVEHVEDIVRNANLFRERWGFEPMEGWIEGFAARDLVVRDQRGRLQVAGGDRPYVIGKSKYVSGYGSSLSV